MVPKDKNCAAFPAKTKENLIPKEVIVHAAKERPKAKAAPPPRGGESKTVLEPLVRKTEAPNGLRGLGMPTKALLSKLTSRKAKAES